MVAWFCLLLPVCWGASTLKNDLVLGVGLLFTLMAAERAYRRHRGGLFLALLGGFVLVGSKATGFVYAVPLVALAVALDARNAGRGARLRRLAGVLPLTLGVLAISGVQQIATWLGTGSPVHPVAFVVFGVEIFPGPLSLEGTSILEHLDERETWLALLAAPSTGVGPEFPLLVATVIAAWVESGLALLRRRRAGERPDTATTVIFAACCLLFVLWLAYLATPLTRGRGWTDLAYLRRGHSLRFAVGQLFASYAVAAAYVTRQVGPRFYRFLGFALICVMLYKGHGRISSFALLRPELFVGGALLAVLGLVACLLHRDATLGARFGGRVGAFLRPAIFAGVVLAFLAVFRQQVEVTRQALWMPGCRSVWTFVREAVPPASRIAMSAPYLRYRYVLYGESLDNVLEPAPEGSLEEQLAREELLYLSYAVRPERRAADFERLERLRRRGWTAVGSCGGWFFLHLEQATAETASVGPW